MSLTNPDRNVTVDDLQYYEQRWAHHNLATIEPTTTASKAYAIGGYLVYSGQLYKVTSPISSGGTIVVTGSGANVVATTVSENLGTAASKGVTDSTSASAISTGTSLVTERDVYYGLPSINDSHTYNSGNTYYAPTSAGTSGQVLTSNGSGAPSWVTLSMGSINFYTGTQVLTDRTSYSSSNPVVIESDSYVKGCIYGDIKIIILDVAMRSNLNASGYYGNKVGKLTSAFKPKVTTGGVGSSGESLILCSMLSALGESNDGSSATMANLIPKATIDIYNYNYNLYITIMNTHKSSAYTGSTSTRKIVIAYI